MIKACELETPIAPNYLRNNRSTRQKSLRCFPTCGVRGHVSGGFCGQSLRANLCLSIPIINSSGQDESNIIRKARQSSSRDDEKEKGLPTIGGGHIYPTSNPSNNGIANTNNHGSNFYFYDSELNEEVVPEINDFIFIMEIRPLSQPRISAQRQLQKQDIISQIRTKFDKTSLQKELFMGEIKVLATSIPKEPQIGTKEIDLQVVFNSSHSSWDYSWKSNRWSGPNEKHVVDIIVLKYVNALKFEVVSFYTSDPFIVISSHKKPGATSSHGNKEGDTIRSNMKSPGDEDDDDIQEEQYMKQDEQYDDEDEGQSASMNPVANYKPSGYSYNSRLPKASTTSNHKQLSMFDETNQTNLMGEAIRNESGRKKPNRKRKLNQNLSANINLGINMEMSSGLEELLKASEVLSYLSSSNIFPVAQDVGMSATIQPIFQNLTTESARAYLSAASESIVLTSKGEITSDYLPAYYQTSKERMLTNAGGDSDSEKEEPVAKAVTRSTSANGKPSSKTEGQKKRGGTGPSKGKSTNQINESSRGMSEIQRIGGIPNTSFENEVQRGSTRYTAPALGPSAMYSLPSSYLTQPLSGPADEPIEFLRKEDLSGKGQYHLPIQLRNTDDMISLPTKN